MEPADHIKFIQLRVELSNLLALMDYSNGATDAIVFTGSLEAVEIHQEDVYQDLALNFFVDYGRFFSSCISLHCTIATELQLYAMARAVGRLPKIREVTITIKPSFEMGAFRFTLDRVQVLKIWGTTDPTPILEKLECPCLKDLELFSPFVNKLLLDAVDTRFPSIQSLHILSQDAGRRLPLFAYSFAERRLLAISLDWLLPRQHLMFRRSVDNMPELKKGAESLYDYYFRLAFSSLLKNHRSDAIAPHVVMTFATEGDVTRFEGDELPPRIFTRIVFCPPAPLDNEHPRCLDLDFSGSVTWIVLPWIHEHFAMLQDLVLRSAHPVLTDDHGRFPRLTRLRTNRTEPSLVWYFCTRSPNLAQVGSAMGEYETFSMKGKFFNIQFSPFQ